MSEPTPVYEEEKRRRERPAALRITLGVVGTLLGVLVIFVMLLGLLATEPPAPNVPTGGADAPTPEAVLRQLRAREEMLLTTYGWVDREKGVVRIPVEAAMEKVIEERSGGR